MTPQQAFDEMNYALNKASWQKGRIYIFVDDILTLQNNICLEMQGEDMYILANGTPRKSEKK